MIDRGYIYIVIYQGDIKAWRIAKEMCEYYSVDYRKFLQVNKRDNTFSSKDIVIFKTKLK